MKNLRELTILLYFCLSIRLVIESVDISYIQIEWISVDIIHNPSKEETHDFKVGQSISIYVIIFFSISRVVERGVI
jgi:hypothetical protein